MKNQAAASEFFVPFLVQQVLRCTYTFTNAWLTIQLLSNASFNINAIIQVTELMIYYTSPNMYDNFMLRTSSM